MGWDSPSARVGALRGATEMSGEFEARRRRSCRGRESVTVARQPTWAHGETCTVGRGAGEAVWWVSARGALTCVSTCRNSCTEPKEPDPSALTCSHCGPRSNIIAPPPAPGGGARVAIAAAQPHPPTPRGRGWRPRAPHRSNGRGGASQKPLGTEQRQDQDPPRENQCKCLCFDLLHPKLRSAQLSSATAPYATSSATCAGAWRCSPCCLLWRLILP
jgi:hypothetical protein